MSALVESLIAKGERRGLADGEQLCREGEAGDDAFVVLDGELAAVAEAVGGPIVIARHGAGALVGEITALVGGHRTATLNSVGATTVAVVPRDRLRESFDEHPAESDELLRVARERTDRTRVAVLLAEELDATDGDVVAEIATRVSWRNLKAGDVLFRRGDAADAAYLVVSGRLGISDRQPHDAAAAAPHRPAMPDEFDLGAPTTAARGADFEIGRGGVVGEFGLLEQRTRTATVSAVRDTTLARLSAADFAALTSSHTDLAMGLLRRVLDRSRPDAKRRPAPARSVVVVTATDSLSNVGVDPVSAFGAALEPFGSTVLISADSVDATLGRSGIANTPPGEFGEVRLGELLHQLETDHDHVVFAAGDPSSPWAQRVLRSADLVVAVLDRQPSPEQRSTVTTAFAAVPDNVPTWLSVVHPAGTERPSRGAELRAEFDADEVHHVRSGDHADLARVGRLAGGRGFALVLSGGGARGNAHIGVMRALVDHDLPIDRVVGASMGSIIAGGISQGNSWETLLTDTKERATGVLDYTLPLVSLVQGKKIVASLEEQFGGWSIDDTWVPFATVSTNLTTAEAVDHRTGPMVDAVRASIAIPGVLPPVPYGKHLLVDGGVLHNLPVHLVAGDPSIGTIIASDVAPPVGPGAPSDFGLAVSGWAVARRRFQPGANRAHPRLSAVLMRSMLIGSARDRDDHIRSGLLDLYLELDLRGIGLLDFSTVDAAAERGFESAEPLIAAFAAERAASNAVSPT